MYTDNRQGQSGERRGKSGYAHADEVHGEPGHHHVVADEVEQRERDRAGNEQHNQRRETLAQEQPHWTRIGCAHRHVQRQAYPIRGKSAWLREREVRWGLGVGDDDRRA